MVRLPRIEPVAQLSVKCDNYEGPEPRRSQRLCVNGEVTMRRAAKLAFRVRLYDLSPDGCKAEFVERPEIAERLWIRFDGMEALEANVRWIAGAKVGLKFARPIYPAVFEALAAKLRAAA
jgi:hypothetical protein